MKQIRIRKSKTTQEVGAQQDSMLRILSETLNAERAVTNQIVEELAARITVLETKLNTYNAIFVNVSSSMPSMGFRESVKFMIQMLSIVKGDGSIQEGYFDENTTDIFNESTSTGRVLHEYTEGLIESASEDASEEEDTVAYRRLVNELLSSGRSSVPPRRR